MKLWDRPQGLQRRVHVTCVAQVLQSSGRSALQLRSLRLVHVLQELDLLLGLLDNVRVAGRCAHHHDSLVGLETQFGHVSVIFKLTALDDDLLALGLDAGDGVELVFERLAVGGGVDLNLVLLALVLYYHYKYPGLAAAQAHLWGNTLHTCNRRHDDRGNAWRYKGKRVLVVPCSGEGRCVYNVARGANDGRPPKHEEGGQALGRWTLASPH